MKDVKKRSRRNIKVKEDTYNLTARYCHFYNEKSSLLLWNHVHFFLPTYSVDHVFYLLPVYRAKCVTVSQSFIHSIHPLGMELIQPVSHIRFNSASRQLTRNILGLVSGFYICTTCINVEWMKMEPHSNLILYLYLLLFLIIFYGFATFLSLCSRNDPCRIALHWRQWEWEQRAFVPPN